MSAFPHLLREVLAGFTTNSFPQVYGLLEVATWGLPAGRERAMRRNKLRDWLKNLSTSSLSAEWQALAHRSGNRLDDGGDMVLRAMLRALQPIEIANKARTKKAIRIIGAAAEKLHTALVSAQAAGENLRALTPGRALQPLIYSAVSDALEPSKAPDWQGTARRLSYERTARPELLLAWLEELKAGCYFAQKTSQGAGRRGKSDKRVARALAICIVAEIDSAICRHEIEASDTQKCSWAATIASAATAQEISSESLRITESRN